MKSKLNPYIILDFETGGLVSGQHAITEIAMICLRGEDLREIGRYESYVKPYLYEYDQKALDYTGLSLQKLDLEGKPVEQVTKEVFDTIEGWKRILETSHTKKPIVVGHNVSFDIGFLQQIYKENKADITKSFDCSNKDFYGNSYPKYMDTMILCKLAFGNDESFTSYKLTNCIQKAGLSLIDAHKAMNDVEGTKELLITLTNRLRSSGGSTESEKIRFREGFHFQY